MKHIVIFASGTGTNAENIIRYFSNEKEAKVSLVLSNKPQAKVLVRAAALGVDSVFFDRRQFYETGEVQLMLRDRNTDLIVLAGFLWLVPQPIIDEYRGRIINIHPALLPLFGGMGMYGERVHRAVLDAGAQRAASPFTTSMKSMTRVTSSFRPGAPCYPMMIRMLLPRVCMNSNTDTIRR